MSAFELDGGTVHIHLVDLVEELPEDVRREVAKACAFDSELVRMVVEMVGADTVFGTAFDEDGGWGFGTKTLAEIRLALLPQMDVVARNVIKHLLREHEHDALERKRWQAAYWELWHHHNDAYDRECGDLAPERPQFVNPPWPTTSDIDRVLEEAREKWGIEEVTP